MTSQINRKVNLRFSADPDEVEVYSGELNTVTLEYIRVMLTSVLPNPTNFVDQIVTVEERSVGETVRSYESTVISVETSEDDVELTSCVLILRRPAQFQERRFPRVDVNFPVTIRLEQDQPDAQAKTYEALASNLSVSGLSVILGLANERELDRGQIVSATFELELEESLVFTLNAQIVRKRPLDFGGTSNKYMVAFNFIDVSPEIEDQISRCIFTHQVGLDTSDADSLSSAESNQIPALKAEIYRLQEQLRTAYLQIKEAEESRIRSETIIVQLTRKLNEQGTIINRQSWWKFWDQSDDN